MKNLLQILGFSIVIAVLVFIYTFDKPITSIFSGSSDAEVSLEESTQVQREVSVTDLPVSDIQKEDTKMPSDGVIESKPESQSRTVVETAEETTMSESQPLPKVELISIDDIDRFQLIRFETNTSYEPIIYSSSPDVKVAWRIEKGTGLCEEGVYLVSGATKVQLVEQSRTVLVTQRPDGPQDMISGDFRVPANIFSSIEKFVPQVEVTCGNSMYIDTFSKSFTLKQSDVDELTVDAFAQRKSDSASTLKYDDELKLSFVIDGIENLGVGTYRVTTLIQHQDESFYLVESYGVEINSENDPGPYFPSRNITLAAPPNEPEDICTENDADFQILKESNVDENNTRFSSEDEMCAWIKQFRPPVGKYLHIVFVTDEDDEVLASGASSIFTISK